MEVKESTTGRVNRNGLIKCSVCGKLFIPAPEHLYRTTDKRTNRTKWQCKYTCWKKAGGDKGYGLRATSQAD